jgi:hypothetical protein
LGINWLWTGNQAAGIKFLTAKKTISTIHRLLSHPLPLPPTPRPPFDTLHTNNFNKTRNQSEASSKFFHSSTHNYTDKKENKMFLKYKEIQSGAVAKSYMRKGFLIYKEMHKYFPINEEAVSHI